MKINILPLALAATCLLTLPPAAFAKDKDKGRDKHDHGQKSHRDDHHDNDNDRRSYLSHSRSSFTLSLGNGYAGRGYYYGPPNSSYYYERPEVRYYRTREAAPREYYGREAYSGGGVDASVQRALARSGYYQGSIDGQIGPASRRAIARYQADHGMAPSGVISSGLLRSLGIQ